VPALRGASTGRLTAQGRLFGQGSGEPEARQAGGIEVAPDQICPGDRADRPGRAPAAAGVHASLPVPAHQPGDPLAAAVHPEPGQLGVHPRRAVGAARPVIDRRDRLAQLRAGALPRRGRPAGEGAGPRAGDTEDPAEPLDAVGVTVIGDESEAADRIVSWAK